MRRRLPALWILLLAAMLAGPLVQRSPPVWLGEAMLGSADSSSTVGFALPAARFQTALAPRSSIDRQWGQLWSALPAAAITRIPSPHPLDVSARTVSGPIAETARHFPLFPTGPPSHG